MIDHVANFQLHNGHVRFYQQTLSTFNDIIKGNSLNFNNLPKTQDR